MNDNDASKTFDNLVARAAAMMLAIGRLQAAEERGEALAVKAAIGDCWDELHQLGRALKAHAATWQ